MLGDRPTAARRSFDNRGGRNWRRHSTRSSAVTTTHTKVVSKRSIVVAVVTQLSSSHRLDFGQPGW